MLTALTRAPSPSISACELTFLARQPIDFAHAAAQHRAYEDCLRSLGLRVISLPALPDLPDSVFVEDPAVVLDEIAILTRPGAASRRPEVECLAPALAPFRPLRRIEPPATLEGGDILRAGRTLFAGLSTRTNAEGIAQLAAIAEPHGYTVIPVEVRGCLHLKSAACYLGRDTILANRAWIDAAPLSGHRILDVREDWAADVLATGDTIVIPANFPATAALLETEGFRPLPIDVSELQKAEAGVTCMSLIFTAS
ncbi:MAG TPA: arginine deiminase family protein [Bryobacteraceae bacterium]|jgi:dimethylargininase|nr:arginine deiminase family protein [Bryobacteraceae bacterium]